MANKIIIRELERTDKIPYDLLVIADPSRSSIDTYILDAVVYTADVDNHTVGCYVLSDVDNETIEIKNIVVSERWQGKGIGTFLLKDAIDKARIRGIRKITIGTGNSSVGQLYLYQRVGFRITAIRANFFKDNYSEPIFENGIECRDMIVLTREL